MRRELVEVKPEIGKNRASLIVELLEVNAPLFRGFVDTFCHVIRLFTELSEFAYRGIYIFLEGIDNRLKLGGKNIVSHDYTSPHAKTSTPSAFSQRKKACVFPASLFLSEKSVNQFRVGGVIHARDGFGAVVVVVDIMPPHVRRVVYRIVLALYAPILLRARQKEKHRARLGIPKPRFRLMKNHHRFRKNHSPRKRITFGAGAYFFLLSAPSVCGSAPYNALQTSTEIICRDSIP